MRCAQLLLSLALVQAQYHQHNMPRAKFDDATGAPLNDAAQSILQRHAATAPAPVPARRKRSTRSSTSSWPSGHLEIRNARM